MSDNESDRRFDLIHRGSQQCTVGRSARNPTVQDMIDLVSLEREDLSTTVYST